MTQFSERTRNLRASPIRDILAVIDKPGMISFAGGLPADNSFPQFSLEGMPEERLQYGSSEGDWDLRLQMRDELAGIGLACDPEQILILSGSQQGIDLTAKLFIDPGTRVAVENPCYLAALQVFRFFGADFIPYSANLNNGNFPGSAKLLYTIPTFQNPSGYCYSQADRERLADACSKRHVTLFEDDPYRDLSYENAERTPVCAFMKAGSWIYQGSFSKFLAPGLRLGFLACSKDLIPYLTRLKQAADLHSNRLSQWLVLQALRDPSREQRLQHLVANYRLRRDHFQNCLENHLGELASWSVPQGGLFFWLTLHQNLDTGMLLERTLQKNLAFMPGEHFFIHPSQETQSHLRLNFSHAAHTEVEKGLAILAAEIAAMLHKTPGTSAA